MKNKKYFVKSPVAISDGKGAMLLTGKIYELLPSKTLDNQIKFGLVTLVETEEIQVEEEQKAKPTKNVKPQETEPVIPQEN